MPSPTSSLATQRPDLAASFEEFDVMMDAADFIGQRVLRVMDVGLQSSPFGKIPIEELLQNRETLRAPGGGYNRGSWNFETDSYATQEHGVEEPVDDREAQLYKHYFDAEMISAARATRVLCSIWLERMPAAHAIAKRLCHTAAGGPPTQLDLTQNR